MGIFNRDKKEELDISVRFNDEDRIEAMFIMLSRLYGDEFGRESIIELLKDCNMEVKEI